MKLIQKLKIVLQKLLNKIPYNNNNNSITKTI